MPLPPALQARLQKRGILPKQEQKSSEVEEEVFAEDYDEPVKEGNTQPPPELPVETPVDTIHEEEGEQGPLIHEVLACPNRSNQFHECVSYCKERWGARTFNPESDMLKKRDRMLQKYPIPEGWEEVADPETGRYYYWNTITDEVSWLSPIHPRAQISVSAEKLKALNNESNRIESQNNDRSDEEEDMEINESESDLSSSSSESESEEEKEMEEKRYSGSRRDRGSGRERGSGRQSGRQRQVKDDIDPMDPAAYSDIPRGGWSSGLDRRGEAKTGVDATASGPLFQQRPYPSPGEILRRNREMTNPGKS